MMLHRLWSDERALTLVLVNFASVMEQADEALLPGVYKEIGETLHTGLAALGSLTLLRSITQALCFPLAAYFSIHYDRARVIAAGAFLWAIATFFVGVSRTFTQIAVSRALNGIGLALVVPAIQSLVADSCHESKRGTAFGLLQLTSSLGTILGGFLSITLAGTSFLGIKGWRLSFLLVTIVSVVLGILLLVFAVDPVPKTDSQRGVWSGLKEAVLEGKMVVSVRTFQILVAQGVVGSFPWAAMAFAPLWLELKGFSHTKTAFLLGLFTACGSLGGVFSGVLGDTLSKRLPDSGRIILAQFSSGSGVPITAILLLALPSSSPPLLLPHALVFCVLGFCTSWNAPATNNPIFAEIVPEKSRTTIYALDRSLETVLASFAPPVVGLLAEHLYGYVPPRPSSDPILANKHDAVSLGRALYTAYSIPMTICCLTYSLLYWSYPKDRDKVRSFQPLEGQDSQTEMSLSSNKLAYRKSKNGYFVDEQRVHENGEEDKDELLESLEKLETESVQL